MKKEQIFENEVIEEALRLNSSAYRMVDQEANDILIGVEYEYHCDSLDAGHGGDGETDWDAVYQSQEYYDALDQARVDEEERLMAGKKTDFIEGTANSDFDKYDTGSIAVLAKFAEQFYQGLTPKINQDITTLISISNAIDGVSSDINAIKAELADVGHDYNEYISCIQSLSAFFSGFSDTLTKLYKETGLQEVVDVFSESGDFEADEFSGDLETNIDQFDDVNRTLKRMTAIPNIDTQTQLLQFSSVDSDVEYFVSNFEPDNFSEAFDFFEKFYDGMITMGKHGEGTLLDIMTARAEDSWNDYGENEARAEIEDELVDVDVDSSTLEEIAQSYTTNAEDYVAQIEEILQDTNGIDYKQDIEIVETDVSVPDGVEVITNPLPLKRTLSVMQAMFNHIRHVGSTSQSTGMHVNMSIRGLHFDPNDFNPLKMIILLGEDYLRKMKYPVRNYVGLMTRGINTNDLSRMVFALASGGIKPFIAELDTHIDKKEKFQSINFNHMYNYDRQQRRLEFRYFGGADYETRFDEMRLDIYAAAYTMMAAYSPTFAQKEYYQGALRFVDGLVKRFWPGTSLQDMVELARKNPDMPEFTSTLDKFAIVINNKSKPRAA